MNTLTATPIQRDVVLVGGADAGEYLQTQLTQDVVGLDVGQSAWSFLLNPKSGIEFMPRITRLKTDEFVLDIETSYGPALRERLDGLLFRMVVTFAEDTWPGVSYRGRGATKQLSTAPIAAALPWHDCDAADMVGPDVGGTENVNVGSAGMLEQARIEAGWPAMGSELHTGITPAMTGLVEELVAFDKGCYTGQEFVARVFFRGATPPKRLVRLVSLTGKRLDAEYPMMVDDASVGPVTSVSDAMALGYLNRAVETPADVTINDVPAAVSEVSA